MKNRNIAKLIARVMVLSLVLPLMSPMQSSAQEDEYTTIEMYQSGSKWTTELDEKDYVKIDIYAEKDLLELAEACVLDTYSREKWVELKADITLSEKDFQIPTFAGVFDGNGHTISNFHLQGKKNDCGFFRYVQSSARIMDLTIEGLVRADGAGNVIGGIAGHNFGVIENCTFKGIVEGENDNAGIAAVNEESGKIIHCTNEAQIFGMHRSGGIAGSNLGLITECENLGEINTHSPVSSIDYTNLTMDELEEMNSTENVDAGIDSGGIAGYCEGSVYDSVNKASVGYDHVGYNTGGIVGRLRAGYITGCTNEGEVKGRKDVGGIVGHMEPFMQLEYMTEKFDILDAEMDEMMELLDAFLGEAGEAGDEMSELIFNIAANLRTASSAMTNLSNSAMYLWEAYNYGLDGIGNEFQQLGDVLESGSDENGSTGGNETGGNETGGNETGGNETGGNETGGSAQAVSDGDANTGDNILDNIVSGGDGLPGLNPDETPDLDGDGIPDIDTDDFPEINPDDLEELGRYEEELSDFAKNTGNYMEYMTNASKSQTEPIRANLNSLNQSTTAASEGLSELSILMEKESDILTGQADAILDQAEVLYDLLSEIRDDLFGYETVDIYDESDEISEALDILQGKIEKSINKGIVEADICVGGIVGQISVEYDTNPEEDIAVEGELSTYANATVRAIISECISEGDITVKRDYAGGIVGKAAYGAVLFSQSYADVDAANGSFIGGVAGDIAGTVRSSYAMSNLNGKMYVGGIAGRAKNILYSCAFASIEEGSEYVGNIAGTLMEEGILHCNFYVENGEGGINGIAYQGGAMPLTYGEMKGMETLPKQFDGLTLVFMADGEIIGEYACEYGEDVSSDVWPQIPEKEGYYSYWPEEELVDIRHNKVVEATYVRQNGGLSGSQKGENGQALLLVEGIFEDDWELVYDEAAGSFRIIDPVSGEECYTGSVKVRYWVPDTDAIWVVTVETEAGEKQVDYTTKGSYLIFEMDAPGKFSVREEVKESLPVEVVYGIIIAVLLTVIMIVTVMIWKKRNPKKQKEILETEKEKAGSEETAE